MGRLVILMEEEAHRKGGSAKISLQDLIKTGRKAGFQVQRKLPREKDRSQQRHDRTLPKCVRGDTRPVI